MADSVRLSNDKVVTGFLNYGGANRASKEKNQAKKYAPAGSAEPTSFTISTAQVIEYQAAQTNQKQNFESLIAA